VTEEPIRLAAMHQEPGTVRLVLDSGEVLELAPEAVPKRLPEPGGSLDSPLLTELRFAAERKKVARRVFAILDRRLPPVARLQRKLQDEGFSDEAVDAVLEQLATRGIYSHRRYAEAWCRDCLLTRTVGRRYLEAKLREKGVPAALAHDVAAEALDSETEEELADRAARQRWRRLGGASDRRAEARVVRFLQGRGFDVSRAWRATRRTRPPGDANET